MPTKLNCTRCSHPLDIYIVYSGADWDTVAGKVTGYGQRFSLTCDHFGLVYPLGGLKSDQDFSPALSKDRAANWPYNEPRVQSAEQPLRKHLNPTARTQDHERLTSYLSQCFDLNYVDLKPEGACIRITDRTGESLLFEVRGDDIWQINEKEGVEKIAPSVRRPWSL